MKQEWWRKFIFFGVYKSAAGGWFAWIKIRKFHGWHIVVTKQF